jgi:hypothetical protein
MYQMPQLSTSKLDKRAKIDQFLPFSANFCQKTFSKANSLSHLAQENGTCKMSL